VTAVEDLGQSGEVARYDFLARDFIEQQDAGNLVLAVRLTKQRQGHGKGIGTLALVAPPVVDRAADVAHGDAPVGQYALHVAIPEGVAAVRARGLEASLQGHDGIWIMHGTYHTPGWWPAGRGWFHGVMPKPLMCPESLLQTDLSGRVYVVTGGNSGIGRVTVAQLARQGAHVVLACRRPAEGERVRAELLAEGQRGSIEVAALDLASLESVRDFAAGIRERHAQVHGLVNNAGVMNTPMGRTREGFETQFGTNHLGHFLLTEELLPCIRAAAPARIVNVSSCYHDMAQGRPGRIDFEDPNFARRPYDGWAAYAQSKLANLLHARHLARRLEGSGISAVSVHPGWVRTALVKSFAPVWFQDVLFRPLLRLVGMIEPWEGTQVTLYALLAAEVEAHPGAFFSQLGMYRDARANAGGLPLHSPNPEAHDDAAAERLDALSRQLVGLDAVVPTPAT